MSFIGISGLARSGKDLFFNLFSKEIKKLGFSCGRFALADELKIEINPFLISHYGIDIFNCTKEEKEIVRPALISHGKIRRSQSGGRYWIDKIEDSINKEGPLDFTCVTDIRYAEHPKDELNWVKKEKGGTLIHISKYVLIDEEKIFQKAANEEEERNDPRLRREADYKICWPDGEGEFSKIIESKVSDFAKWVLFKK